MQANGDMEIENIYKDKTLNINRDTILLKLRSKSTKIPMLGFIRIMKNKIWSSSNSKSNTSIGSNKNNEYPLDVVGFFSKCA